MENHPLFLMIARGFRHLCERMEMLSEFIDIGGNSGFQRMKVEILAPFLVNLRRGMDIDIERLKIFTPYGSDYYLRLMGMRGSLWYIESMCFPWVKRPVNVLLNLLINRVKALEPFRKHKYCVLSYLQLDFMLCVILNLQGNYSSYREHLLRLEKDLDDYEQNKTEPMWEPWQLFDTRPEDRTDYFDRYQSVLGLEYLQQQMAPLLYMIYQNTPNRKKQLCYALRVLKDKNLDGRESNPLEFLNNTVGLIRNVVDLLLFEGKFKQVNHLLAIGMHNCVKLEQLIPKSQLKMLNETKSKFCFFYAAWGIDIFERSVKEFYDLDRPRPVRVKIDNATFTEMEGLIEAGVETYANQFPIDTVNTLQEISVIINRAQIWNKSGMDWSPYAALKNSLRRQSEIINELKESFEF